VKTTSGIPPPPGPGVSLDRIFGLKEPVVSYSKLKPVEEEEEEEKEEEEGIPPGIPLTGTPLAGMVC
jgi:hypothetical protein